MMRLAQIMGRYAVGDLSEDMDKLPGEKAVLTNTMAQVKTNLGAMNHEIKHLAQSAANGDFSARGDAERFQYDFRVMVDSLNTLMSTADGNLQSLSSLLQSIAAGDLTARMSGEFRGVFAQMRDDANATATQLAEIVGSIKTSAVSIKARPAKSRLATRTCRSAPNSRPPIWKKPRPRWKSSPPPSSRMPKVRARPISWPSVRPAWLCRAAKWSARSSRPCPVSKPRRRRSPTSSPSSTALPSKPTSWR